MPDKYKILIDYYTEGMKFWDDTEYDSVDEAVQAAIKINSAYPFLIVKVINWQAKEV